MVPGDFSPHHLSLTQSLGAGGPILYSHCIPCSTLTLTCPLTAPVTRGGREVCTGASSCLPFPEKNGDLQMEVD